MTKYPVKIFVKNRQAFHEYEVLNRYEAGIELLGSEVKSVKNGLANLKDSFVRIEEGEMWLWNCHISPWKYSQNKSYDPTRRRKLLMKRLEIDSIEGKVREKGFTLVPLSLYGSRGKIKVEVGLCRGLKKYERKQKEKEKVLKKELHEQRRKYLAQ